jgi:copper(I)-binding protein
MQNGVSVKYFTNNIGVFLLSTFASCGLASYCVAEVVVDKAWIKLAPPAATANAAYMQLTNLQLHAQTIVGVSADCCAMAMLHQIRYESDKVSMVHLDRLVIPPQSSVQLAPGGTHIMLMQAHEKLLLGHRVIITLTFSDGHSQMIELAVKRDTQ